MIYQHINRMARICTIAALLPLGIMAASVKGYAQKAKTDTTVYTSVETLPHFPGGIDGFMKFMHTTLRYPAEAKKQKVQGRVNVTFVIEPDGSVSGVRAVGRPIPLLQDEAIRTIKASPRWVAGKQGDRAVRTQYTVPVVFSL